MQLSDNDIGNDGAKAIADALKDIHSLEKLDLSRNKIGDDGAKAIADALKDNHTLKSLFLFSNVISSSGKEYLSKKSTKVAIYVYSKSRSTIK